MQRKIKNNKPERIVETEIMARAWQHGFDLTIIDSKAVFSQDIGRYIRGQTSDAVTDLVGNKGPIAVFVELKARGKLASYNNPKNFRQRAFVERKINSGCFACVADSWELLWEIWCKWEAEEDIISQRRILMDALPRKRQSF